MGVTITVPDELMTEEESLLIEAWLEHVIFSGQTRYPRALNELIRAAKAWAATQG